MRSFAAGIAFRATAAGCGDTLATAEFRCPLDLADPVTATPRPANRATAVIHAASVNFLGVSDLGVSDLDTKILL
jgi:hypothetical protein